MLGVDGREFGPRIFLKSSFRELLFISPTILLPCRMNGDILEYHAVLVVVYRRVPMPLGGMSLQIYVINMCPVYSIKGKRLCVLS
jgi:hypothetical protein